MSRTLVQYISVCKLTLYSYTAHCTVLLVRTEVLYILVLYFRVHTNAKNTIKPVYEVRSTLVLQ